MTYHMRLALGLVLLHLMSIFCDDGAPFPPLESGLEEVLDPSLTTLPFVAPYSFSINADEDDMCYKLGNVPTQVPDFHETPLESSCVDVVVVEPTSLDVIAYVSLDHTTRKKGLGDENLEVGRRKYL